MDKGVNAYKKVAKKTAKIFLVSLVVVSLVGSYISTRGHKVVVDRTPVSTYEKVTFTSQAKDKVTLNGWFFPAASPKVALIAHGWGGNRATFLDLAEELQRAGINVLTLDLRGGTGKNTYGQYEQGDVAGAAAWLEDTKQFPVSHLVLIGNSMGGAAAIGYTASHHTAGLVLISSVYDLAHTKQYFARDFHLLFPSIYASGVTLVERLLYGVNPENPKDEFGRITVPTLVLHGTEDKKAPISDVYRLQDSLSAEQLARTQFVIVPNETHTFLEDSSEARDTYDQQIIQFVQNLTVN